MRVKWLRRALTNLEAAGTYIAEDNPKAARETVQNIIAAIEALAANPRLDISRAGRVLGTRELIVERTYIIAYRVRGDELQILRVLHARQRWPQQLP